MSLYCASSFIYCYVEYRCAECSYAECHYTECRYAECCYAECRYTACCYAECRYAECRYAECCRYKISYGFPFFIFRLVQNITKSFFLRRLQF